MSCDVTKHEYISPIETFTEIAKREISDNVHRMVLNVGVQVDKKELIKALEYDRQQYEKGYEAGYAAAKAEITRHRSDEQSNVCCVHDFWLYGSDLESNYFICTKCGEQKKVESDWNREVKP